MLHVSALQSGKSDLKLSMSMTRKNNNTAFLVVNLPSFVAFEPGRDN